MYVCLFVWVSVGECVSVCPWVHVHVCCSVHVCMSVSMCQCMPYVCMHVYLPLKVLHVCWLVLFIDFRSLKLICGIHCP